MSKHKVTRYDEGGDVDAMEMANKGENLDTEAGPKVMPRRPVSRTPAPAAAAPSRMSGPGRRPTGPSAASPAAPTDTANMSVNDRIKASRLKSRAGTTDTRSVGERLKSAFGMAKGGSVSSASSRADGCATKGKTKGTMVMCGGGMSKGKK
jgi:hypothetical protein